MGEVVTLKQPRKETIRGAARSVLTDALNSVGKPVAIVIVALGHDGSFAMRRASYEEPFKAFDVLSRAGSVIDKVKVDLVE